MATKSRLGYTLKVVLESDSGFSDYVVSNPHMYIYHIQDILKKVSEDSEVSRGYTVATYDGFEVTSADPHRIELIISGVFMAKVETWDIFDYDAKLPEAIEAYNSRWKHNHVMTRATLAPE